MKLSTFGLGLVVAVSSFAGISAVSHSATAATIGAENGTFNFTGAWEFTFLYSSGGLKSSFGIDPSPTLFSEIDFAVPGSVTPNTPVTFVFPETGTFDFFLLSPNQDQDPAKILSGSAHNNSKAGFIFASSILDVPATGFFTDDKDGSNVTTKTFADIVNESSGDGALIIAVNDSFSGDEDYNDFVVKAKAVPVPAIVPGIALAGAFLGSKALKRNKKDVAA